MQPCLHSEPIEVKPHSPFSSIDSRLGRTLFDQVDLGLKPLCQGWNNCMQEEGETGIFLDVVWGHRGWRGLVTTRDDLATRTQGRWPCETLLVRDDRIPEEGVHTGQWDRGWIKLQQWMVEGTRNSVWGFIAFLTALRRFLLSDCAVSQSLVNQIWRMQSVQIIFVCLLLFLTTPFISVSTSGDPE